MIFKDLLILNFKVTNSFLLGRLKLTIILTFFLVEEGRKGGNDNNLDAFI
jgi:hypothetical protein